MAFKKTSDLETEVDDLVKSWIEVSSTEQPEQYKAWRQWRMAQMGSYIEPKSFTVPWDWPPRSVSDVKEYFAVVRKIRRLIGWTNTRSKLTDNPSAWMG
jgi:hypothetical protein